MIRLSAFLVFVVCALPAWAEVKIQEVISPGGIKAWLVQEPSIPFAALELRFRGGTSLDAPEKRGATYLMTGLLEEGAGDLDARGFARAVEALAASFDYDAGDDSVSVSARFLTENRDAAVALLRSSIIAPSFDQSALDRVRDQVLSGLRSDATNPNDIARKAFDAAIYGDHPYGSPKEGSIDSVAALTRQDMIDAHRAVFAKDRLYVGAAGDISAEALGLLLDDLLGALPDTGAAMPPAIEPKFDGSTTVVSFDTPQSVALFGQPGISQDDPDFFAARILNQILGAGGFESRLMTEVREKRGLTYGVYSYLVPLDLANSLQGQVASANDRIADAIDVIKDEWRKAASVGVTAKEVEAAKTYITGAYPLRFDGNGPIARIMVGMQMLGLPIDYIPTRNDKVNAVTVKDVNRMAAELLDPTKLTFVVVGQPEGLGDQVSQ